jgi:hypothetical protein
MNVSGQGNWMDKLFHKKLSGFEISPEDHIWEGIARKLDESQRRPGLFGGWWTILLSVIITLLVIGAGAFLFYKKKFKPNRDLNPNRDLPYTPVHTDVENTVYAPSEMRSILTTPQSASKRSKQNDKKSVLIPSTAKEVNQVVSMQTPAQSKITESATEITAQNSNLALSIPVIADQLNPNELIASSDKDFFTNSQITNKAFSYSYLPLKESFLKKDNQKFSSSMKFVDGCNVYRNNKSHFFLDIYYAPEIASRTLESKDPALQQYVDERAHSERPILSYSMGVKASLVFGNGFTVRTGLSYSNNSERFDYIKETQTITKEIKDQNGNVIKTEVSELIIMDKIYNSYKYLDIPVLLGYEADLKDFVLSLNGGIGINLSASQTGKIYKDTKNPRSFYLLESNGEANGPIFRKNAGISLISSIGFNYKYNERIMLLFEPSARYYLHSLSDPSNPISQNYLFLGMNVGMRYRIK